MYYPIEFWKIIFRLSLIAGVLFFILILSFFILGYFNEKNIYLNQDINKIKYAKPTREAKNFNIEEYIKNLPPVEYTKIDYPVKETIKYEFNGYVLTMDIPEGFEYENIYIDDDLMRVININSGKKINDLGKGDKQLVSDKKLCVKGTEKNTGCYVEIIPYKSHHQGISMRDIYIGSEIKNNNENDEKYITNAGLYFLVKNNYYVGVSFLTSDQQELSIINRNGFSKDLFFSMLDTVRIERIEN